jgi:hypothetical protein
MPEIGQRSRLRGVRGFGQHHRQLRHELAMASRVRRLFVDADIDQVDQRFEQFFQLRDQQLIRQRHAACAASASMKRWSVGEKRGLAVSPSLALISCSTPTSPFVVAHGHRQEGLRVVAVHGGRNRACRKS